MIYLTDYEEKTVDIYYRTGSGKGEMHIGLAVYMDEMPLTKIKKLLNIIRTSDTPEVVDDFKEYAQKWLAQYEIEQKALANAHVDAKEKVSHLEQNIKNLTANKKRFKPRSDGYKHYLELIKTDKEVLRNQKAIVSSTLSNFKANVRNKEKFEKVIDYIEQGR